MDINIRNFLRSSIFFLPLAIFSWYSFAQETIECQLIRQKIMRLGNETDTCRAQLQQCLTNARYAQNFQRAELDCNFRMSGCQLGESLGKRMGGQSELEQAVQQYKYQCER